MIFTAKKHRIGAGQEPASDYEVLGGCCKGSRVNNRNGSQNYGKPSLDFLRGLQQQQEQGKSGALVLPSAAACSEPHLPAAAQLGSPAAPLPGCSCSALQQNTSSKRTQQCDTNSDLRKNVRGRGVSFLLLGGLGFFKITFSGKTCMIDGY